MNTRPDADIQCEIDAQLKSSRELDARDIAVNVTEGTVSLSGFVRSFDHKYAAEAVARTVAGVLAVANDIELQRDSSVPDPQIARESVSALGRERLLCGQRIQPLVHQGIVTLRGGVATNRQRVAAEQAVRGVAGVVGVVNSITLAPVAETVDAEAVKRRMRASFPNGAPAEGDPVNVESRGAEVTLRGYVRTWADRRQAEESARTAPGVEAVHNELVVRF